MKKNPKKFRINFDDDENDNGDSELVDLDLKKEKQRIVNCKLINKMYWNFGIKIK
jgi:hypothetical protein